MREGSLWYYAAMEDAYRSRVRRLTADASGTGATLHRGFRVHLGELGAAADALLELAGAERAGLAPPPG